MAWVAVHDEINGPKLRALARALKCDLATATGLLIFLWQWGLRNADETGRVLYANISDVQECVIGKTKLEPEFVVESLVATGWIDVEDDGSVYLHDWADWQKHWYRYKDRAEKDKERKREIRKAVKEAPVVVYNEPAPQEVQEAMPEVSKRYTDEFEEVWKNYPRKVDKGLAYKKYQARINSGYRPEDLLEATKNYAKECVIRHTESRFIKHGATFFGDSTPFEDYIPSEKHEVQDDDANPFAEYTR